MDAHATTLGIDLAAQPENTGLCVLEWTSAGAHVAELTLGADDTALATAIGRADITAIDAPFGWPQALVASLVAWQDRVEWPGAQSRDLRFRATDLHVREITGHWPLSPSADRIAVCAWRCARLLTMVGVEDRLGAAGVLEVYPAGALKSWGLPHRGYKPRGAKSATTYPAAALRELTADWLHLSREDWDRCCAQHDLFDSLVCALVARAAMRDELLPVPETVGELAAVEGWIQLPRPGSLARLA